MPNLNTIRLLEQLEKLKADTETTHANFNDTACIDDDCESASVIRQTIAELMAVNNTLLSLSLRWTYLHKRQCRDLMVYTENQQIKVKLINSDNTQYPGEFFVSGFGEVDGDDIDAQNEPVLTKEVAVYDRSALKKGSVLPVSIFKSDMTATNADISMESKANTAKLSIQ